MMRWFDDAERVEDHIFPFFRSELSAAEVWVAQCGIGKVNAALCAYEVVRRFTPDYLLNVGVCGALHPSLAPGDIALSEELVYHDVWCGEGNAFGQVQGLPPRFQASKDLLQVFAQVDSSLPVGLFCCGEYFVPTREELARIGRHFPDALAVDMESAAIAQVAYWCEVPYLSARIVSDTPCLELDHSAQYAEFWARGADASFARLGDLFRSFFTHLNSC